MAQLRSYASFLLIGLLVLVSKKVDAQEFGFTQWSMNKASINPAFVAQQGDLLVNSLYKQQWNRLADKNGSAMVLSGLNAEIGCPKYQLGIGGQLFYSQQGAGDFSYIKGSLNLGWGFNGSFSKSFGIKSLQGLNYMFHFGAQLGLGQKSVEWGQFNFSDQYDPYLGLIKPTSAVYEQGFRDASSSQLDIGFGGLLRLELPKTAGNLTLGAAMYSINRPKESFLNTENEIPQRLNLHAFWHKRVFRKESKKLPIYLNVGIMSSSILPESFLPPISNQLSVTGGFSFNNQSADLALRFGQSNAWSLNSIAAVYQLRVSPNLILSGGAEFATGDFSIGQSGFTFDLGLAFSLENKYLCGGKKKDWNFNRFQSNFLSESDPGSLQRFIP
jgi:type IX secretion system PorP/SprF family membrane protein